jgi:hypothetical protein
MCSCSASIVGGVLYFTGAPAQDSIGNFSGLNHVNLHSIDRDRLQSTKVLEERFEFVATKFQLAKSHGARIAVRTAKGFCRLRVEILSPGEYFVDGNVPTHWNRRPNRRGNLC